MSPSSSSLQLDLPPIPNRIIATSPSPSSEPSIAPNSNANMIELNDNPSSLSPSLLFSNTTYKSNGSRISSSSSNGNKSNPERHLSLNNNALAKTPSELDLSKTPPPRSFAPSPPLPISRTPSEVDLLEGNDHASTNGKEKTKNGTGNGKGKVNGQGSSSTSRSTKMNGGSIRKKLKDENDLSKLMRTIDFAARKHSCQRRKDVDQTPYINHPIAVSNYLSSTGITDVKVLQAAVLHDTVEDTHTTIEEIAQSFGTDVARIVEECTDDNTLSGLQRKTEQLRSAPYKSREAQQVKLADKIHNLESIRRCPPVGWGIKRIQAYFIWAKQVTDVCAPAHPPLAEKLQELYETAYTRVDGVYHPCHPGVCGPLTEHEKELIDSRLRALKKGDKVCPAPIFF